MGKRIPLPEPEKRRFSRRQQAWGVATVVAAAALIQPLGGRLYAQASPKRVISSEESDSLPVESDAADVPLGSEPIRIRVESSQGVFLVFDAANSPYEPRRHPGFAAYWLNSEDGELYLYDRLLYDFVDVGHALANLERDLGVDIEIIYASDDWLAEAYRVAWDQREDSTGWLPPGRTGIARLMGYHPTTDGSDDPGVANSQGGNIQPCLDMPLPITDGGQPVVTYPLPLPRGGGVDDLITYVVIEQGLCPGCLEGACCACTCCGGNCCSSGCCPSLACCQYPLGCCGEGCCPRSRACCQGICCQPGDYPVLDDCELDDGNPCTDDSCQGPCCYHTPVDCDDGDACTDDSCDAITGDCQHHEIGSYWYDLQLCSTYGYNGYMSVTDTILPVNNDDDDGNGTPDWLDEGPVAGENDLIPVDLFLPPPAVWLCDDPADIWRIWDPGAYLTNVYWDPERSQRLYPPLDWNNLPAPAQVYVEGRYWTSACGVPLVGNIGELDGPQGTPQSCCGLQTSPIRVVRVYSLDWRARPGNEALGVSCPNNYGRQVFPGKLSPTDNPADPLARRKVDLVATIRPAIAGVQVYIKVWDVDDPFDQLHGPNAVDPDPDTPGNQGVIPDVEIIDNDREGPDNRPVPEQPMSFTGTTDENGEVTVTLTVSMQPGNNYRAAATLLDGVLNGTSPQVDQSDADAYSVLEQPDGTFARYGYMSAQKVAAFWSPMLTVWRKLTVEVDSMDKEALDLNARLQDNEWTNAYPPAVDYNVPTSGFTTVHYDFGCLLCDLENRWEGGAFVTPSGDEFLIVRNTHTELILWGYPINFLEQWCTIRDDDQFFADLAAPRQLPQTSVITGNIVTAYRDAYIEITEASDELNPNRIVPWRSNVSAFDVSWDHDFGTGVASGWDLDSYPDFWLRHFVVCYQPGTGEDTDPDPHENCAVSTNCLPFNAPYPLLGLSPLTATMDELEKQGLTVRNTDLHVTATSTVYKETIRDGHLDPTSGQFWQYVAHEIGHSTLDINGQKNPTGTEHNEGGLMADSAVLQNLPEWQRFAPTTLIRFRGAGRW